MQSKAIIIAAVVVVVIAILYFAPGMLSAATGNYNVAVQMTDPPSVPPGTQQLIISYSSVQVHTSGAGNQSGWASASGSGSLNLMALQNVSQTIANAQIKANSTIDLVRFNITSAKIVINGTTYNVSSPNNQVNVAITGGKKINASAAVVVDFYPTVNAHGNSNSTAYVLVPAARAVVVTGNSTVSINTNLGGITSITSGVGAQLGLNLSIGGSGNTSSGNSITVHPGQEVSNFLVKNISYSSGTVFGLIYIRYPVATSQGINTTLRAGNTVGYACDGTEFNLTSINSNDTATFTHVFTSRVGGCPV